MFTWLADETSKRIRENIDSPGMIAREEFSMNALVTALPGLVIIFVLAGGVNALAGVLSTIKSSKSILQQKMCNFIFNDNKNDRHYLKDHKNCI